MAVSLKYYSYTVQEVRLPSLMHVLPIH